MQVWAYSYIFHVTCKPMELLKMLLSWICSSSVAWYKNIVHCNMSMYLCVHCTYMIINIHTNMDEDEAWWWTLCLHITYQKTKRFCCRMMLSHVSKSCKENEPKHYHHRHDIMMVVFGVVIYDLIVFMYLVKIVTLLVRFLPFLLLKKRGMGKTASEIGIKVERVKLTYISWRMPLLFAM